MSTNTPHLDIALADTLTACQWARRLNVSPSTITRWALAGSVEFVQVGREIRITAEAMERCLRNRTEARQRRHQKSSAGSKAKTATHSAEVEAELAKI